MFDMDYVFGGLVEDDTAGGATGERGSRGTEGGGGGGERPNSTEQWSDSGENSGGVRLLSHSLERAMQAEIEPSRPGRYAGPAPTAQELTHSGASENDEFFYSRPLGTRSTPPALASGSAGRISNSLHPVNLPAESPSAAASLVAVRAVASINAARDASLAVTNRILDDMDDLRKNAQAHAADAAEQKKLLVEKEESVQELQEKLSDAMGQIRAKDAAIDTLQHTVKALVTPIKRQTDRQTPGMSTGSLDLTLARSGRDLTTLPPRPKGPIPTDHEMKPYRNQIPAFAVPNTADDVFREVRITPTQALRIQSHADHQKPLQELLSSCFNQVETAIRQVPTHDLVPPSNGNPTFKQRSIIQMLQDHLQAARQPTYDMLKDAEGRYWAVIGLVSHAIVDSIFLEHIIGSETTFAGQAYIKAFYEELRAASYDHPQVSNYQYRNGLAEQRASAAKTLAHTPGFWVWVKSQTYSMTHNIVDQFAVCFPGSVRYKLTQSLHHAIREAVRIAIRMRQEPNYIEYNFPPVGTPWNSSFHVWRNPQMIGENITEDKPTHCVQIAMMPLIQSKSFANNMVKMQTIHKAEVILGERDAMLKQLHSRR